MITNCPVCGKGFDVLWPHLWRYRRGNSYLCSWKCLRLADNEREKEAKMDKQKRGRLSAEVMAKAVKMFRDGDSGLDQYLADNGVTNIKKWKENAKARYGAPEITVATVKIDEPIRIQTETPEKVEVEPVGTPPDVTHPVVFDGMTVREIEGNFGRYRRSDVSKEIYIDFEFKDINDTISMTVDQWRLFQTEIERADL